MKDKTAELPYLQVTNYTASGPDPDLPDPYNN